MYSLAAFLKGLLIQNEVDTTKQLVVQVSPSATTATTTTITATQTANRALALPDVTDTLTANAATQTLTNKTIDGDDNTVLDLALSSLKTDLSEANNFLVRDVAGDVVSDSKVVPAGVVVGTTDAQVLTNKTIDADLNTLSNIENADIKAAAAIAVNKLAALTANRAVATDSSGFLTPSATTDVELGYVSGVTSSIQAQLDAKPDASGAFTDNHIIRADGAANVQNSQLVVDDSGNVTGVTSMTLDGGGLTVGAPLQNGIQANASTSLNLSTNLTTQSVVVDRRIIMLSPASGLPARLVMREDSAFGVNEVLIQPEPLAANRTLTIPDATTTIVGTDATQTLTNKTFGDAITNTQIATPSNPVSGSNKLYFKSDESLYTLSSAGVETAVGAPSLTNPMTTLGDIITGGIGGTPTRLGIGTEGQALISFSGEPEWGVPAWAITSQSATYAVLTTDTVVLCSGASFTLTLPTAVGFTGKIYVIKHNGTSLSQVYTLNTTSSQTIGGVASGSYQLLTNREAVTLVSDGSNWQVVSHYATSPWVTYTPTLSNVSTGSSISFQWRRVGDTMTVRGSFVPGVLQAGLFSITLPASSNIDANKLCITNNNTSAVGDKVGDIQTATANAFAALITAPGTSTSLIYMGLNIGAGNAFIPQQSTTGNGPLVNTLQTRCEFEIPIANWQS